MNNLWRSQNNTVSSFVCGSAQHSNLLLYFNDSGVSMIIYGELVTTNESLELMGGDFSCIQPFLFATDLFFCIVNKYNYSALVGFGCRSHSHLNYKQTELFLSLWRQPQNNSVEFKLNQKLIQNVIQIISYIFTI